jgi:hypothetical protein
MFKYILDKYFEETTGNYPFFKYCPKQYIDYYVNKKASNILGYEYNYRTPKTLNEKIRWLIFNENLELKTKLTDKILMKGYVSSKLGANHTAELYGIYKEFDEIDFSILPDKYALKTNHGWKMNVIVQNRKFVDLNKNVIRDMITKWLNIDYSKYSVEPQYKNIQRHILIEQLRPINRNKNYRCDFKVHCINGNPEFIEIPFYKNDRKYYQFYSVDFNLLNFTCFDTLINENIEKPIFWEEMLEYSKILSKDFSYVRIDFAPDIKKLHVVELTFTPCAATIPFSDKKIDFYYGEMLQLPKGYN